MQRLFLTLKFPRGTNFPRSRRTATQKCLSRRTGLQSRWFSEVEGLVPMVPIVPARTERLWIYKGFSFLFSLVFSLQLWVDFFLSLCVT
jgi:hypothetical protein